MNSGIRSSICRLINWTIQLLPGFGLIALVVANVPLASAASATGTGMIEGRVKNAVTGAYLNNARVAVPGTTLLAFTDRSGGGPSSAEAEITTL